MLSITRYSHLWSDTQSIVSIKPETHSCDRDSELKLSNLRESIKPATTKNRTRVSRIASHLLTQISVQIFRHQTTVCSYSVIWANNCQQPTRTFIGMFSIKGNMPLYIIFIHYLLVAFEIFDLASVRKCFIEIIILFLSGAVNFWAGNLASVALAAISWK